MNKHRIRNTLRLAALAAALCLFAAPCLAVSPPPAATAEAPVPGDDEVMAYFAEIAFDSEYGGENAVYNLRRWEQPLRVRVLGNPTDEDLATLDLHIEALNQLETVPEIRRVDAEENVRFYFLTLDGIRSRLSGYVEGNWGFFWCWWNEDWQMVRAQIAIATDVTDQAQRNHLILEEFTQVLGLMQDSYLYPDSIFYGEWTEIQRLSALDWTLVQMLYDPGLEAGMTAEEALEQLRK